MSLFGLLILLLILSLLFGGWGSSRGWGYYGWSPLGILIVIVLIFVLVGGVHASALAPAALSVPLALGTMSSTSVERPRAGPPGLPYNLSYILSVVVMVVLAGLGFLTAEYTAGHGANFGLTPQAFSWIALVGVMLGALAGVLPNIQHTPEFRRRELRQARAGLLPPDLHNVKEPGGEPGRL